MKSLCELSGFSIPGVAGLCPRTGFLPDQVFRRSCRHREMRMLVENSNDLTVADASLLRIIARARDIQKRFLLDEHKLGHANHVVSVRLHLDGK